MAGIVLRSTAFNDHDLMPDRFSRPGGNVSPPLEWGDVPPETRELVLLVDDPDGGPTPFLHWLVTGIDPGARGVGEGQLPPGGREWTNSFGSTGWAGPQPPKGDNPHRYFFRLFAVREPVRVAEPPDAAKVHEALAERQVASGNLVGMFAR